MNTKIQIVNDFLLKIIERQEQCKLLILDISQQNIINIKLECAKVIRSEDELNLFTNEKYKTIIGDIPFGMSIQIKIKEMEFRTNKSWSFIFRALLTLEIGGKAYFFVEPSLLTSVKGKRFLSFLSEKGYNVNAIFDLPEKLLMNQSSFTPILLVFDNNLIDRYFIGEITSEFDSLIENYFNKTSTNYLTSGILVDRYNFDSFNRYKVDIEINNLKTQYKDYKSWKLSELGVINRTETIFEDKPNSIYIPTIGNSEVVSGINNTKIKHQNYFQVVLDDNSIRADYLSLFYHSEIGRLILKSLVSYTTIPHINKEDLENSSVALPNLPEQDILIQANRRLLEIKDIINQLNNELSLNPKNANTILDKFDSIQKPLKQLSFEDEILSLIRKGENKYIEFKETFSKNIKGGNRDKDIEKSSLKSIVGFLNSEGGTLLIGVSDDGRIKGIENDFFKSADKYKLYFQNKMIEKILPLFEKYIDYDLYSVSGMLVFKVDCQKSSEPCFYEDNEFYIRSNPATNKLDEKKQHDYIKTHFV
jgi:hypothetical protein